MKKVMIFLFALVLTLHSQTLTYHTDGPVKENNFETWGRFNLNTPSGGGTNHSFGNTVHTGGDIREYRNINCWTWSNDDIPKEAIVYKVKIEFTAIKSSNMQDMNISLHNISATYQESGVNFYNECKSTNKILDTSIPHNNWIATFDKTFTTSSNPDVVNAINSAVQSEDYYFTLGIKCQGSMLNDPWEIGDANPYGTPEIDLTIFYTTENQTYTLYNMIDGNTTFGDLIVNEDDNNPINSGDDVTFILESEQKIRTSELPFILNWDNTTATQKHQFWQAELDDPKDNLIFELKANLNSTPKNLYANFDETEPATIASYLEGINGGDFEFKDP